MDYLGILMYIIEFIILEITFEFAVRIAQIFLFDPILPTIWTLPPGTTAVLPKSVQRSCPIDSLDAQFKIDT